MDGVTGFEPVDDGIKIRWLTACRHPNIGEIKISNYGFYGLKSMISRHRREAYVAGHVGNSSFTDLL